MCAQYNWELLSFGLFFAAFLVAQFISRTGVEPQICLKQKPPGDEENALTRAFENRTERNVARPYGGPIRRASDVCMAAATMLLGARIVQVSSSGQDLENMFLATLPSPVLGVLAAGLMARAAVRRLRPGVSASSSEGGSGG